FATGSAYFACQKSGARIDVCFSHSGRLRKFRACQIRSDRQRLFHKIDPNRKSRLRAGKPKLSIVVETYPNDAHKIRREPGKPSVERTASLSCRQRGETHLTCPCRRSAVQHILHYISQYPRNFRSNNLLLL